MIRQLLVILTFCCLAATTQAQAQSFYETQVLAPIDGNEFIEIFGNSTQDPKPFTVTLEVCLLPQFIDTVELKYDGGGASSAVLGKIGEEVGKAPDDPFRTNCATMKVVTGASIHARIPSGKELIIFKKIARTFDIP